MMFLITDVEHSRQRYETAGDWQVFPGAFIITVSDTGNPDYTFLLGLHELLEAYLCERRGITQDRVDAFDIAYEERRPEGDTSEPGDDQEAPYRAEHAFATRLERMVADELGVDWAKYEQAIQSL